MLLTELRFESLPSIEVPCPEIQKFANDTQVPEAPFLK